jgi:hypothetical protein
VPQVEHRHEQRSGFQNTFEAPVSDGLEVAFQRDPWSDDIYERVYGSKNKQDQENDRTGFQHFDFLLRDAPRKSG